MSLNTHPVVLLAFAMVLSGCATEPDAKPETGGVSGKASDPLVIEARAGDETRMRRGQLLAIALDSNASTGYAWEIVEDGSPLLEPAPPPTSTRCQHASALNQLGRKGPSQRSKESEACIQQDFVVFVEVGGLFCDLKVKMGFSSLVLVAVAVGV